MMIRSALVVVTAAAKQPKRMEGNHTSACVGDGGGRGGRRRAKLIRAMAAVGDGRATQTPKQQCSCANVVVLALISLSLSLSLSNLTAD
jgi:hypothetical protein